MHSTLSDFYGLRIGRELDETRIYEKLAITGRLRFIKGCMVGRYSCSSGPVKYLNEEKSEAPISTEFERIAWRDVSRNTQKRRLQATILPKGTVTGNSLGIAYSPDFTHEHLCFLLAVFNPICEKSPASIGGEMNRIPYSPVC